MAPLFLTLDEVVRIHVDMIGRYGGSQGLRDPGLLESAVSMPRSTFGGRYLHEDLFHMAAAYLFHIVANHPFIDGNKRTGAAAAIVFLFLNDVQLKSEERGLEEITLSVAKGESQKQHVAEFSRNLAP